MALPAFTLPYTDTDFASGTDVVFEVGGGGDLTATVELPQAGTPALTYGYYNYKTMGAAQSDSLAKALCDALTAEHGSRTFTPSEGASGMDGRLRIVMSGTPATLEIKWTDAGSTFPGAALGFDTSSNSSGTSSVTSTWPVGRMWLPPRSLWVPRTPLDRVILSSRTLGGYTEVRKLLDGPQTWDVRVRKLALPWVFLWAAADADWYAAVADMVQSDPNSPFEALWTWLGIRFPLRYHPDRDTDATYNALQVADPTALASLMTPAGDPFETGSNPLVDVQFKAIDFVAAS